MHELSVAESILDVVTRRIPQDAVLVSVDMRIGFLQAIDTDSLRFGWQAVLAAAGKPDAVLNILRISWRLRCDHCGSEWEPADTAGPPAACLCGAAGARTIAGLELDIVACDVKSPTERCDTPECTGEPPSVEISV